MVLTATNANTFTQNAISIQDAQKLQQEVDLTERNIRNAATRQLYAISHDARIVGNPDTDPQTSTGLTALQTAYRDAFTDAGYLVTLDATTGHWRLSWESTGVEASVAVYTIRTTLTPGAISDQTIAAIDAYFDSLSGFAQSSTKFIDDTSESDYGATDTVFYEYISTVRQQDLTVDYSNDIRTALVGGSLGYTSTPSNVFVYKLV